MNVNDYVIPDPWPRRAYEWLSRNVTCKVLGHKWQPKMHDYLCPRCSASVGDHLVFDGKCACGYVTPPRTVLWRRGLDEARHDLFRHPGHLLRRLGE